MTTNIYRTPTLHARLADEILAIFKPHDLFRRDDTGEVFQAMTETDLMARLRERGWRLPPAGFFSTDVQAAGFKVTQGYQFPSKVRRAFSDGSTGRALSDYQTIIHI